jgi:hypothetical protein
MGAHVLPELRDRTAVRNTIDSGLQGQEIAAAHRGIDLPTCCFKLRIKSKIRQPDGASKGAGFSLAAPGKEAFNVRLLQHQEHRHRCDLTASSPGKSAELPSYRCSCLRPAIRGHAIVKSLSLYLENTCPAILTLLPQK